VTVVPSAPLLLPGYAGRDDAAAGLRDACVSLLGELAGLAGGAVVLVAATDREPRSTRPPVGRRVGELLLRLAGVTAPDVVEVPWDAPTERCVALGRSVGAVAGTGEIDLVVVADGSARRSEKAPGYLDERSFAFDDAIVAALAAAEPDRLLALDASLGAELLAQGRAPLQVAAAAMGERAAYRCVSLDRSDPFGVLYVVARLEHIPAAAPPRGRGSYIESDGA
jgi:hypothetical protein